MRTQIVWAVLAWLCLFLLIGVPSAAISSASYSGHWWEGFEYAAVAVTFVPTVVVGFIYAMSKAFDK